MHKIRLWSSAAGIPVLSDRLAVAVAKTMVELSPLAFLLEMIFLILLFRRISGVIYPMLIVFLSIMVTVGASDGFTNWANQNWYG